MASTLYKTFVEFKEWLMTQFATQYSPYNSTYTFPNAFQEHGDKMLKRYTYTAEREEFLIRQAKFYIKANLDIEQSHNTSINFLEKLMNKMAAYLSSYVMQKYPIPDNGRSKNKLRERAQEELRTALFVENSYIKHLQESQAKKRNLRQYNRKQYKRVVGEQKREERQAAYRRTCEIRTTFFDAQNTPRKKH